MSPKEATALRIDVDLMVAMRQLKAKTGIPVTTQLEMAVRAWLKSEHGVIVKSDRKRVGARKRP